MSKIKQTQAENNAAALTSSSDSGKAAVWQHNRDTNAFQALNAELSTVNRELRDKIAELQAVNNDLHNLLGSTVIATIFLDPMFRIRRYTPAAKALFNLAPADIGRRLTETGMNIGDQSLCDDVKAVLENLLPVEKEVLHEGRRHYCLRRITPYRTSENRIEGVVLTYTDISRIKRTEEQLRVRERQHAVVAEMGWKALSGDPLQAL